MIGMSFEKLVVWQKGMGVARLVYEYTIDFPKEEIYGLRSQMRDAAVSVPSNIAEGSQQSTPKAFAKYILIAKGSLAELRTQTFLAKSFNYLSEIKSKALLQKIIELDKMLHAFHSAVRRESKTIKLKS